MLLTNHLCGAAKVYHRDLKPKNILANSDCKLKVRRCVRLGGHTIVNHQAHYLSALSTVITACDMRIRRSARVARGLHPRSASCNMGNIDGFARHRFIILSPLVQAYRQV